MFGFMFIVAGNFLISIFSTNGDRSYFHGYVKKIIMLFELFFWWHDFLEIMGKSNNFAFKTNVFLELFNLHFSLKFMEKRKMACSTKSNFK
jgi:hypothetical protein